MERYNNWTSRLLLEMAECFTLKVSKYLWILIEALMFTLACYSISRLFIKKEDRAQNNTMLVFMMLLYPLNAMNGSGWATTTTVYMWPLATGLFAIIPIRKIWDGEKIKAWQYPLYSLSLIYSGNQEQTAAILFGVYIVFSILMILKNKKIHPYMIIQNILIIASLIFFAWGEIRYIFIMLLLAIMDYICGKKINQYFENKNKKKIYLFIDIGVNLLILFFFKYADFIISNINNITNLNIPLLNIPLPIGVSFNTFQSLSYIIDVYRGTVKCEKSFYNYLAYTTLFPQIIAGPIVRYETVDEELENKNISIDNFTTGMKRFIIGLGKKVLIANNIGELWHIIEIGEYTNLTFVLSWFGIIAFALQIYFDFSGYSDMAIGLAKIFGMEFDENFNFPYISKSITEFWRRWHITLSSWFKDYIYIPLGGNKKGLLKQIRNILIVWFLTGAWHGASWNFILWGLYFGVILILEKIFILKILEKAGKFISHIYAIILILIGWVIFAFEDLKQIAIYFKSMFNINNFINNETFYLRKRIILIKRHINFLELQYI